MGTGVTRPAQSAKFEGGPADGMNAYLPSTDKEPHLPMFRIPCKVLVNLPMQSEEGTREVESFMTCVAEYSLKYVGIMVDTYEFKRLCP